MSENDDELSFLGKWLPVVKSFVAFAARGIVFALGPILPTWAPEEFKQEAFYAGLLAMLISAIWGIIVHSKQDKALRTLVALKKNKLTSKNPQILSMLIIGAIAIVAVGCASPYDGVRRGPFMHHSINKAYRLAEQAGGQPVKISSELTYWVTENQLKAASVPDFKITATAMEFADREQKILATAKAVGQSCEQIVNKFNPNGRTWAAVGDGALVTGLASAIIYGVTEAVDGDDGDGGGSSIGNTDKVSITADIAIIGDGNDVSQANGEGSTARGSEGSRNQTK